MSKAEHKSRLFSTKLRDLASPIDLRDQLNELLTLPLMALRELPESCQDIAVLRASLNSKLLTDFSLRCLSESERKQVQKHSPEAFLPTHLHDKWDRFILEAAQQYGPRILLSDHVLTRVWRWATGETFGSQKLERLFSRLIRSVRVGLRQVKGTITNRHRHARKFLVRELHLLRTALQSEWPESPTAVRQFVSQRVQTSVDLPNLKQNAKQLLQFLGDDEVALAFLGDPERSKVGLTPSKFCDKWFARSEYLSEEYVRQSLLKKRSLQQRKK